jgi:hypothetical protein
MMVSAVMLSGAPSREFASGVSARLADGADERAISVGISTALICWPGLRQVARRTDLGLPGDQMAVAAQHADRVTPPRTVQRFEQMDKKAPALCMQSGLAFRGIAHR